MNLYKKKFEPVKKPATITSNNSQNTSQFIKYKYLKPKTSAKKQLIIKKCLESTGNLERSELNNHTQQIKSINTNNYIINTINLSEKTFINNSMQIAKQKISSTPSNIETELNNLKKEKEQLNNLYKKQERLIERLIQDNKNLTNQIADTENENHKLNKKINVYKENQEQLVMLVKIIQKNGVDIETLIDKWNSELENETNNDEKEKESYIDSLNSMNDKDGINFIPIIDEEKKKDKKIVVENVQRLNFDMIKNNMITNKKK